MPEKKENVSTVNFLTNYGPRVVCGEVYYPDDDTCDQRAPVNDPEALYNTFIVPEEVMSELDSETLDDFEGDIYDYEDRTDLGVDIALASDLSLQKSKNKKIKESKKESAEHKDVVDESKQSVAE